MKIYFLMLFFSVSVFSQYNNRDGNRIGISAGISQTTLFSSNFETKPALGYVGGLSVRGNYFNNWSMTYGMQFFSNNFIIESTSSSSLKETEFNLQGAQVRILLSYNLIEDHLSFDFGPVLQVNSKLTTNERDENNILKGTLLTAKQLEDISAINGNFYIGITAGYKVVRGVVSYQYGFTNIFSKLNKNEDIKAITNNQTLKGNLGTINGQIIINL